VTPTRCLHLGSERPSIGTVVGQLHLGPSDQASDRFSRSLYAFGPVINRGATQSAIVDTGRALNELNGSPCGVVAYCF
jgi:hypothetical protein